MVKVLNGEQENTNPYEEDDNMAKALVNRIRVELTPNVTIGNSIYWDNKITEMSTDTDPLTGEEIETSKTYSLFSDGVMLRARWGEFQLLSEAVIGVKDVRDGDSVTQYSWYVQPSYTMACGLTPYAVCEFMDPDTDISNNDGMKITGGLNYEVNHSFVVKLENGYFKGGSATEFADYPGRDYNEISVAVVASF